MDRILGLDVGDKKIGIAVSDPFGQTAQGVATLPRRNFKKDCEAILNFVREYQASKILIGLPLNLQNEEGPQAGKVRAFHNGLKKFLDENKTAAVLELVDESFSSREAESILLEADLSRKKRKKVIDRLAAARILQNYLDEHRE